MDFLFETFTLMTWKNYVMFAIGGLLIFLAIAKKVEPALLMPMGFGAILVNIPKSGAINQVVPGLGEVNGILDWMFHIGIEAAEVMPLLLFIGIGAMIDFGPLLANPRLLFFGFAAQLGIFLTIIVADMCGFSFIDSVSIGIIGAADGPTAILVSQILKSNFVGAIAVVAYSYMALVPIIQPAVIKLITTKKERKIKMEYKAAEISRKARIMFPIIVTMIAGIIAPASIALVGFLMFGNLLRECKVLDALSETAQKVLSNLVTLLLGITISASMKAELFVSVQTLLIMCLGLFAFIFDTVGGVMLAKLMNVFSKNKINPMVGAAGISAFPMSARVVQKMGQKENPENHLLMFSIGANVGGQIASVLAGGVILSLIPAML